MIFRTTRNGIRKIISIHGKARRFRGLQKKIEHLANLSVRQGLRNISMPPAPASSRATVKRPVISPTTSRSASTCPYRYQLHIIASAAGNDPCLVICMPVASTVSGFIRGAKPLPSAGRQEVYGKTPSSPFQPTSSTLI